MTEKNGYRTSELEIASFLKSRGHRLVDTTLEGRFVTFEFDNERDASRDVHNYFAGAQVSAREIFEAHRALRQLIKEVKDHALQVVNRTENRNAHRSARS